MGQVSWHFWTVSGWRWKVLQWTISNTLCFFMVVAWPHVKTFCFGRKTGWADTFCCTLPYLPYTTRPFLLLTRQDFLTPFLCWFPRWASPETRLPLPALPTFLLPYPMPRLYYLPHLPPPLHTPTPPPYYLTCPPSFTLPTSATYSLLCLPATMPAAAPPVLMVVASWLLLATSSLHCDFETFPSLPPGVSKPCFALPLPFPLTLHCLSLPPSHTFYLPLPSPWHHPHLHSPHAHAFTPLHLPAAFILFYLAALPACYFTCPATTLNSWFCLYTDRRTVGHGMPACLLTFY